MGVKTEVFKSATKAAVKIAVGKVKVGAIQTNRVATAVAKGVRAQIKEEYHNSNVRAAEDMTVVNPYFDGDKHGMLDKAKEDLAKAVAKRDIAAEEIEKDTAKARAIDKTKVQRLKEVKKDIAENKAILTRMANAAKGRN